MLPLLPRLKDLAGRRFRLKARWVVPCDGDPIEDGFVECDGGRIAGFGAWQPALSCIDLGDIAILPGFVNVHSHLEYTILRGIEEDLSFFPWIRSLVEWKQFVEPSDWLVSAQLGAVEMAMSGVTTVGDASDSGASVAALATSGLRGVVYREFFGLETSLDGPDLVRRLGERVSEMQGQIERFGVGSRILAGVSPHAPYTVRSDLFQLVAEYCLSRGLRQMVHVDESLAEQAWMRHGSGPFAEMYERRKLPWRPQGMSSFSYLERCGAFAAPTLAAHCVHTDLDDTDAMRKQSVAVAHCPRSNAKLGSGIAPVGRYLDAGVELGLGTDSPLTANAMDFFEEIRAMIYQSRLVDLQMPGVGTRRALGIATRGGARALGIESTTGSLAPGLAADLIGVRLDGIHMAPAPEDNCESALVFSARPNDVVWTMVEGRIVQENGFFPGLDVARLRREIVSSRRALRERRGQARGA